ncbi:hypothetical protein C8J57DRAFT_1036551, partial [Mycena rebaudengoi]
GSHFVKRPLWELGLRVQLGPHQPGEVCPSSYEVAKESVVYDLLGIHVVNVNFCKCEPGVHPRQQLLRACWWPAMIINPQTCATFNLLRFFQILNCLGKIPVYDY